MSDHTYPCPKCGYPSQDPEICDSCGVIYARYGQRDFGFEPPGSANGENSEYLEQEAPARRPFSLFRVIVVCGILIIATLGGFYFLTPKSPRTPEGLAVQHRILISGAKKVFANPSTPPAKLKASFRRLKDMTLNLMQEIAELPKPRNEEEEARYKEIQDANGELLALLDSPYEELRTELVAGRNPFAAAETRLTPLLPTAVVDRDDTSTPTAMLKTKTKPAGQAKGQHSSPGSGSSEKEQKPVARSGTPVPATPTPAVDINDRQRLVELAMLQAKSFRAQHETIASPPGKEGPSIEHASSGLQIVTQQSVDDEVLRSSIPAVLYFWAPSCNGCKTMSPVLLACCDEFRSKIRFCSINYDLNPRAATRFSVNSLPTILLIKNGKVAKRIRGTISQPDLETILKENL